MQNSRICDFFEDRAVFEISEAAPILKIHAETLRDFIRAGRFPAVKVGNRYRVGGWALNIALRQGVPIDPVKAQRVFNRRESIQTGTRTQHYGASTPSTSVRALESLPAAVVRRCRGLLPQSLPDLSCHDGNVANFEAGGRSHQQSGIERHQLASRGRSHVVAVRAPVCVKLFHKGL